MRFRLVGLMALALMGLTGCSEQVVLPQHTAPQKLTLNPEAAELNVKLGISYLNQGAVQRAQQKLQLAYQQNPKNPTVLNALAYYYGKTGQADVAEKYYQKALKLDPKGGRSNNNYGVFLCQRDEADKALTYFVTATQDAQYLSAGEAFENAGVCALKSSTPDRAEYFFKQAILRDKQRTTAFLELARLALSQKEYQAAQQYLEQFSQFNPDNRESLQLKIEAAEGMGNQYALNGLKEQFQRLQSPIVQTTEMRHTGKNNVR